MEGSKPKRVRCSLEQQLKLVDMLEENMCLHTEHFNGPNAAPQWEVVAKVLNELGPSKDSVAWKNTWRDLKQRVRQKYRTFSTKQGEKFNAMTDLEERVIKILLNSPTEDYVIEATVTHTSEPPEDSLTHTSVPSEDLMIDVNPNDIIASSTLNSTTSAMSPSNRRSSPEDTPNPDTPSQSKKRKTYHEDENSSLGDLVEVTTAILERQVQAVERGNAIMLEGMERLGDIMESVSSSVRRIAATITALTASRKH